MNTTLAGTSVFAQLLKIMERDYPNYSGLWKNSRQEFGPEWEREISLNIARVFGEAANEKWPEAVAGYAEFCTEALRSQIFFEKHGRYKASNYAEVAAACYHSPDYMNRRYLPGQYLSHYIWPHHQRMLRHFCHDLLPAIKSGTGTFHEVGVGCGMYSQKTLEHLPEATGTGFDISSYALEFTRMAVEAHGYGSRYRIENRDILAHPIPAPADFVINQEVLEHLEDPAGFIKGLHAMVRPGGHGYITAAINAAHTDHIYLYRSPDEVRAHLLEAGWKILDVQIEQNYPEKPEHLRPTVAGFFVRKSPA
jgi:SAM-dependent methyltransferase